MYDLADVNDVSKGRDWSDGSREWLEFKCYGLPGGHVVWEAVKEGKVLYHLECMDWPWWKCVKESNGGLILEFGVRAGASIRQIALATKERVYGFDWWRGLPHSADGFTKGDCLAARPVDLPENVELVDGLFSDTLPDFLLAHPGPIGFLNLDCDLFSSSYYVLNALKDRFISGSLIALSDIAFSPLAQMKAWIRYRRETGQHWVVLGKNHPWGEVWKLL